MAAQPIGFNRVVQFGVRSKVRVHELSRILMNPKNAVRELLKFRQTLSPFSNFGSKSAAQNAGKSLRWQ